MKKILFDSRVKKGRIWNIQELVSRFPFGKNTAQWNQGVNESYEEWIDDFVYEGFCHYGVDFLKALEGRFCIIYDDTTNERIFIARDWNGEIPFHYLVSNIGFYFANTICAIKDDAGHNFSFEDVRAFPQSHFQIINKKYLNEGDIGAAFRTGKRKLYYDFEAEVNAKITEQFDISTYNFTELASLIKNAIIKRASKQNNRINYLLLSGGLDSLSMAVAMKSVGVPFETLTLSIDGKAGGEAEVASAFSKKLEVNHRVITISNKEIISRYEEAVQVSETYHLYNVYCAVGMLLLGQKLSELGIKRAFCGEGMNEAVGDYKDWVVYNPILEKNVVLQKINTHKLQDIAERILYVHGHTTDNGKYNRQLGTGLAKHAGGRMMKPFLQFGIELECPYYEPDFLSSIIALSPEQLAKTGHKPGLLWKIFHKDFISFGFDENEILNCKKTRLQDASENGEYGISTVLIAAGNDQEKTLSIFNSIFKSNFNVKVKAANLLHTT